MGEIESSCVHTFTRLEAKAREMLGARPAGLQSIGMTPSAVRAALLRRRLGSYPEIQKEPTMHTGTIDRRQRMPSTSSAAPIPAAGSMTTSGKWEPLVPVSVGRGGNIWARYDARLTLARTGSPCLSFGLPAQQRIGMKEGSRLTMAFRGRALALQVVEGGPFEVVQKDKKLSKVLSVSNAALRAVLAQRGSITYRVRACTEPGAPAWVLEPLECVMK